MNKELIERIVAEVDDEMESFDNSGPGPGIHFFEPAELTEFVTRCIARIDAERGKGAFLWVDADGDTFKANLYGKCRPLFLSPTIPEGMALMPIEPTDEIFRAMQCSGWMPSNYAAMLAAGQRQIAAGGVRP